MRDDAATSETPLPGTPPPKPAKSTNAVISQRVEEILRLRIDGANFADIRDYADAPERAWGISDSQIKRYIQKSDELLRERTERGRGKITRIHLARRETLFARAVQSADLRTALAVLYSDAKLRGLFDDTKKLEHLAATLLAKVADLEAAAHAHHADRPTTLPASRDPAGGQADRGDSGEPVPLPSP